MIIILLLSLIFNINTAFAGEEYQREMEKIAKQHLESSLKLYKESEIPDAKIELQKAFNLSPDNKEIKDLLRKIEGEEFISSEDDRFNDTVKELYENAMKFYRKEEFAKALTGLEKALALSPKQERVLKFYNEVKEKVKPKEPINSISIENPVKEEPKRKKPLAKRKDTQKIKSDIEDFNKTRSKEFYKTGLMNYKNGKFEDAIFYFEQALKLNPSNARARKSLERAKLKAGKIKK